MAALFNLDLHVQLAALRQVADDVTRVDDLDVVRGLDVGGGDRTFTVLAQDQGHFVAVVQTEHHALEVQHDVDHVFLHAVDRRVLVQHASDGDFRGCETDHRRQQHATQRVAEGVAIAALERLERDLGTVTAERFHLDGFGFQQIRLHEVFLSIPSARYTDKAAGPTGAPCSGPEKHTPPGPKAQRRGAAKRTRRAHRAASDRINANTVRRSAIR